MQRLAGGSGNPAYTAAIQVMDDEMDAYIHDNTDDEITHWNFLNAYLVSKGAAPANLDAFRTLMGSTATGVNTNLVGHRLTNLTQLTIDTSWWTRYRSRTKNPDFGDSLRRQFPVCSEASFRPFPDRTMTSFHFATIEQGGTSLYPSLAQRVSNPEVLRIVLSIGPTEAMHFQTWSDKAGNAPPLTDPKDPTLVFPDLNAPPFGGEEFQTNLIMPEPCPFLSRKFPPCSIIRPTETNNAARGALTGLAADGLFIGQSTEFSELLQDLAADADAARHE